MGRYFDHEKNFVTFALFRDISLGILTLIALSMWGCPQYGVWKASLDGEAELKRAQQNRQIAVLEAQAKLDSAKLASQAEVERARGVAESNQIIGAGLKGNEEYLRYLWIQGMQASQMQVVYVPTEAGMPILEAGKRPSSIAPPPVEAP